MVGRKMKKCVWVGGTMDITHFITFHAEKGSGRKKEEKTTFQKFKIKKKVLQKLKNKTKKNPKMFFCFGPHEKRMTSKF